MTTELTEQVLDFTKSTQPTKRDAQMARYLADHSEFAGKHQMVLELERHFNVEMHKKGNGFLGWSVEIPSKGLDTLHLAGQFAEFVRDRNGEYEATRFFPSIVLSNPACLVNCIVGHLRLSFNVTASTVILILDTVKSPTDSVYLKD